MRLEVPPGSRACWAIAIIFALISGLMYWPISLLLQPGQPLPVTILYRFGDTDYLDLYYAAARFRFHEFLTIGIEPPRIVPFPFGLAYVYGLPIMLFGDAGFIVGDAAVSVARIAVCMLLARAFFRTPAAQLGAAIVLFTLTGPLPLVSRFWPVFFHPLWDLRAIRPFISGLCAMTLVYTTWQLHERLADPRAPRLLCVLHGALIALTAQGDLHTGIIATFATGAVLLAHLLYAPRLARQTILCALLIALAAAVVAAPMAYQTLQAHPDLPRRVGQVPLSRTAPPLILSSEHLVDAAVLAVLFGIIARWRVGGEQGAAARRLLGIAVLYVFACFLALPLSTIVLGKNIQFYHFGFRADGFTILGYALVLAIAAGRLLTWRLMPRWMLAGAVVAVAAVHLAFIGYRGAGEATTQYQQRPWDGGWSPIAGYRPDLIALWKELAKPEYAGAGVLGTFDQQLGMLWASRDDHHVWLPDPFLSTVPDAAIERRVLAFAQLVGMPKDAFARHLHEEYFYNHLLNGVKWQASRFYTFSNLAEYPQSLLGSIAAKDWSTTPPEDELNRLENLYRSPLEVDGRLDLIILNRTGSLGGLRGPAAGYRTTYANKSFVVWQRTQ